MKILSWVGSLTIVIVAVLLATLVDVRAAGNYIFLLVTILAFVFCAMYSQSRWKETQPGRAVMYMGLSFVAVGIVICLSLFLGPDYHGREFVRLTGYLSVALALFNMVISLRRYQRESKIYLSLIKRD